MLDMLACSYIYNTLELASLILLRVLWLHTCSLQLQFAQEHPQPMPEISDLYNNLMTALEVGAMTLQQQLPDSDTDDGSDDDTAADIDMDSTTAATADTAATTTAAAVEPAVSGTADTTTASAVEGSSSSSAVTAVEHNAAPAVVEAPAAAAPAAAAAAPAATAAPAAAVPAVSDVVVRASLGLMTSIALLLLALDTYNDVDDTSVDARQEEVAVHVHAALADIEPVCTAAASKMITRLRRVLEKWYTTEDTDTMEQ
jgi:hypothetical protein